MKHKAVLEVFYSVFLLVASAYGQSTPGQQPAESPKDNVQDLKGTRWDGSIDWTEKGRVQGRHVDIPYRDKVTFRFLADGTCISGKGQPCKWEQKEQTVIITVERTKTACPGSASLTLQGKIMTGSWEHYGGFTCFHIPPPRNIKLTRHK
jgi:hypothetical protein